MYRLRSWSVRHARWLKMLYAAFESLLVSLDPLLRRIGYDRLDRLFAAAERATKIQQALQSMHRRDKEILLFKYEHGWSYREIAEHLGVSHSAVEARLHRARQRLRQELVRKEVFEPAK